MWLIIEILHIVVFGRKGLQVNFPKTNQLAKNFANFIKTFWTVK